jgi:hypothetical protein
VSKKRRIHAPPIVLGGVEHFVKAIPAGYYNVIETREAGGTPFKEYPETLKSKYQQYRCSFAGYKRRVRTYCACEATIVGGSKTIWCNLHFSVHSQLAQPDVITL